MDSSISMLAVVGVAGRWVKILLPDRVKGTPSQTVLVVFLELKSKCYLPSSKYMIFWVRFVVRGRRVEQSIDILALGCLLVWCQLIVDPH